MADNNTPIPEGFGRFWTFSQLTALGNEPDAAFVGSSHPQQAIYAYADGSLVLIADATTPIPGGTGNFDSFGNLQSLGEGNFVFAGFGSGQEGIYAYVDGSLSVIADLNTPIPGGEGNFRQIFEFAVSSDGDIFFNGRGLSPQNGIYRFSNGSLSLIVSNETFANEFSTFRDFGSPVPLGGGNVAFMGSVQEGEDGIYAVIDGVLEFKVGFNTPYPGGTEPFTQIDSIVSLDGDIGFRGYSSAEQGGLLVIIDDSITVIADLSTTAPGGSETFSGFDPLVSLGGGNAAFRAATQTQSGIYAFIDNSLVKVADNNTLVPGGTGNFTDVVGAMRIGGGLAFSGRGDGSEYSTYTFIDGEIAIVADTNTPIPGGSGNFTAVTNAGWLGGENLVLSGTGAGQSGIYTSIDGTIELVADLTTTVSGGAGHFTEFNGVTPIGGNDLAFVGYIEQQQKGIYRFIDGDFSLVADLNTPVPGGDSNFTQFFNLISLGGGDIAFNGEGQPGQRGIYTFINGDLAVVVDENTPIPEGTGNFTSLGSPTRLGDGNIAFLGEGTNSQSGIYADFDGSIIKVADRNTLIPGGTGNFSGQFYAPVSIGDGDMAFIVEDPEQPGIYAYIDGVLSVIADRNTAIPGSTDTFAGFGLLSAIGGKDVAFYGWSSDGAGIYSYIDNVLGIVADMDTPIPGGAGNFNGFDLPVPIGEDDVAFWGFGVEQNGIFTFIDGVLEMVAINDTETPDGWGNFSSFSTPVSLGEGNLAFKANAAGEAIYRYINGRLSLVANGFYEIPGGRGEFDTFDNLVSLGEGVVGFRSTGYLQEGLYYAVNTGSITIIKETEPDGIFRYFEFIGTDLSPMCRLHYFLLLDGESSDCDLVPGQYTINETVTPDFALTNIDCVGESQYSTSATGVIIDLEANDNIVCTFTNTRTDDLVLNVNLAGSGSGSVTSSPEGINCPGICFADYSPGTVATLTAVPGPNSSFSGWEGDCAGDGPVVNVTMNDYKFCTATFTRDKFSLSVTKIGTGTGTVTSVPTGIDCGEDCTELYTDDTVVNLSPTPAEGSTFAGWTGSPDCSDGAVTMDSDKTCSAIFNLDSPSPPTPPTDSADISVTKSAEPNPVEVGGEIIYSISVENLGPDEAPGAYVVDILSPELTFVSASEGCTLGGNTVICNLGDISSGETTTKTIVVIPTLSGAITNTATVNSTAFDPNPNNNTSTVSIQAEGGGGDTDSLILVPDSERVVTGEEGAVNILVEISNPDQSQESLYTSTRQTANGVVITADLPEGFTLNQLTASQGSCNAETSDCLIGDIPTGGTASVEIDATAPAGDGVYIVSFFVTTSTGQTFTGNVEVVVENSGGGSGDVSGGCSLSAGGAGTRTVLPLYLLIAVFVLFRRVSRKAV